MASRRVALDPGRLRRLALLLAAIAERQRDGHDG